MHKCGLYYCALCCCLFICGYDCCVYLIGMNATPMTDDDEDDDDSVVDDYEHGVDDELVYVDDMHLFCWCTNIILRTFTFFLL